MRAVYVGQGAFVPGIPARDLTAEEVEQYGGVELLGRSGCWVFEDDEQDPEKSEDREVN